MWPPEDDVQPTRPWEELVAQSRRRGTRLRRRRRAVLAAPVLALVGVLAVPYAATVGDPEPDALVIDEAAVPEPPPRVDEPAPLVLPPKSAPSRRSPRPAALPAPVATPRSVPLAAPPGTGAAPPPRVVPAPSPTPSRVGSSVVAYSDKAGDGYTYVDPEGTVTTDSESDPARDIPARRVVAERDGVRVTMDLAGDRSSDDDHYAFVTDARSGCEVDIAFGSRGVEGYYAQCPDGFNSPFVEVPHVKDPSPQRLVIFVPYRLFPTQIDPARPLSALSGQTRRRHGLNGQFRGDTAATSQVLAGRPSERTG